MSRILNVKDWLGDKLILAQESTSGYKNLLADLDTYMGVNVRDELRAMLLERYIEKRNEKINDCQRVD